MASLKRKKVTCPKCSGKQEITVWESMNVTLAPDAKQDLFENKINLLECRKCGTETQIHTNMLYHDMEKEFCVMYLPFSMLDEGNFTSVFNRHGELGPRDDNETTEERPYNYMNHIHPVLDMEELKRYILFRDKLFEDYKELEVIDKVEKKLLEIEEKYRRGELEDNDKPIYIYPEDLK